MNTPSQENESFKISENETKRMVEEFESLAEEVSKEGKLPSDAFSLLSNLLFVFQDFERFVPRPSGEQLRILYTSQQKILNNLRPGDLPNFVLTPLVGLGSLLQAEIGRYRILSQLK